MKRSIAIMATMAITSIAMSDNAQAQTQQAEIIGKSTITIEGGLMTPEALWAMGRIGDVSVSPDAKSILYGVSYYSVEQNKSHHTLHIMDDFTGMDKERQEDCLAVKRKWQQPNMGDES